MKNKKHSIWYFLQIGIYTNLEFDTFQQSSLSRQANRTYTYHCWFRESRNHTCKKANSWRIFSGIWSLSLKNLRASEQCLNWSGVRESLGGESGEKSKGLREEETAIDFPADSAAMADLRLGREQGLRTFPVALAIGRSQYFVTCAVGRELRF